MTPRRPRVAVRRTARAPELVTRSLGPTGTSMNTARGFDARNVVSLEEHRNARETEAADGLLHVAKELRADAARIRASVHAEWQRARFRSVPGAAHTS